MKVQLRLSSDSPEQNSLEELLGQLYEGLPEKHYARKELDALREHRMTFYKLAALRLSGWTVAVHHDFPLNGKHMTFWRFCKGHLSVHGSGETDLEAINEALEAAQDLGDALKRVGGR